MSIVVALMAASGVFFLFDGLTGRRVAPRRLSSGLERLLAESGLEISPSRTVMACAGSFLVALFLIAGITSSIPIALSLGAAAGWGPIAYARSRRRRRREKLRDAWPDAIVTLIASVRAGVALPEGLAALADNGPAHLRSGFEAFRRAYRARGNFKVATHAMRTVLADPIADRVAVSLVLAHDVGGSDLVRTLRALSDFVRDDLRIRREIQARWSWTVTAARVAAAAPWIVLVLMATRPEAARAYNSTAGVFVIAGGAFATFVGYRLMLRAARLPEHRRLAE